MRKYSRLFAMVVCLYVVTLTNTFGQEGIDDSQMRESAASRIMKAHGIKIDWRNTSLLDITDIEMRLNTIARIKKEHGFVFDLEKTSLLQLTDAEARMNTAKRLKATMNKDIDWREYSLEDLLSMEHGLSQANTNQETMTLPFDILFPPAKQKAMGLHKLTQSEKQELNKHIETLLIAALQAGSQQITPPPLIQTGSPVATSPSSVIESKIDGEFEGWEGETIVKLMNGQIWQQSEYYYRYHYSFMPDVLIYKSRGGWKMKVEGIDKAVGVYQLK